MLSMATPPSGLVGGADGDLFFIQSATTSVMGGGGNDTVSFAVGGQAVSATDFSLPQYQ
jgi:hypothetical protein